jgi:uncharacterized membrane protein YphA (DoxX/SURF4 family)
MKPLSYTKIKPNHRPTLELIFRLGFAGVFIVSGLMAYVAPASFTDLLSHEPVAILTRLLGLEPLLGLIFVNDLLLGALLLTGKRALYVNAWAGVWLLAVTLVKLLSLV